ncbi:MAG: M28 family peptidase [Planctomycetes bacterium]|nr:M28 family peptidase [Planctomycetota bacterium]
MAPRAKGEPRVLVVAVRRRGGNAMSTGRGCEAVVGVALAHAPFRWAGPVASDAFGSRVGHHLASADADDLCFWAMFFEDHHGWRALAPTAGAQTQARTNWPLMDEKETLSPMTADRPTGLIPKLALLIVWGASAPLQAIEREAILAAMESISVDELHEHVAFLASDALEGRQAGSRGGQMAGDYLVKLLQKDLAREHSGNGVFTQTFGNGYRNILGVLEGRDPQLKKQFILIGAHYDHVGYGSREDSFGPIGQIHNGADDNASGTAVLGEVMQAFTVLSEPPRRSILFAWWDAEEKGLLGSKHWLSTPTVPLENLAFSFNMDMVGRLRDGRADVYGVRTAEGLRSLVSRQNTEIGLTLSFVWDIDHNGDHHPFFERRIPFLMLHTGLHNNYHRPSDDVEHINAGGMRDIALLVFRTALELAESDHVPSFRDESRQETNRHRAQFERVYPPKPPRLGIEWHSDKVAGGLRVARVTPGSAAAEAGIKPGDRIDRFAGEPVVDSDTFQMQVLAAAGPVAITLTRPGQSEPVELQVPLRGTPERLGISWLADSADPATVILSRVTAGSAADRAGLRPGDRVYAVSDRTFRGNIEFRNLVAVLESPLQFLVERHGVLRTVPVPTFTRGKLEQHLGQ